MSAEVGAPQQFKQASRKGKKAWRKHVDITEVQQGLARVREEEIEGCAIDPYPSFLNKRTY